ncbi:signal transduction histidine kinase [Microterricola gilva]|uniref:Oxygen sensor histidine kinase NreB n=1 Tax=Microterricola gilva TaxID=393267 RepID=A0A4Q8ALJ6_9MICO|nr:sensor histidine kinase [Microterricola gilva]RZU65442.1 signal transduction histidine kinase [Microterricola gilva]
MATESTNSERSGAVKPSAARQAPSRAHSALTPVFVTMQVGLHALMVGLTGFVALRALLGAWPMQWLIVGLCVVLLAVYALGVRFARRTTPMWARALWFLTLVIVWLALTLLASDGAYIVFPLFFIALHLFPPRWSVPVVGAMLLLSILALGMHLGWDPGTFIGPIIGAAVAVVLGLAYRALFRESAERNLLIDDLLATREELAVTAREAGTLAERQRLAGEIHDTVAQGLSSIQLLLHAAERNISDEAALEHVQQARQTAADGLAETRRFIRELRAPALDEQSLPAALARLAASITAQSASTRPDSPTVVSFQLSGEPIELPMAHETTLLRIAQGSLANVLQHSQAQRAAVTLTFMDDEVTLDIVDNGVGFEAGAASRAEHRGESFGLATIRERVERLGGRLSVESTPGAGTALAVSLPLEVSP